jgi:non-heme chloroperoxidase
VVHIQPRVLPLLPDNLQAFAFHQRGFGESDHPLPDAGYRIEDLAADAVAFLDAVGVERATLVGHSFGSFVARCIAITDPNRVAGLVLIGTGFTESNPVLRELQQALRGLPDPVPRDCAHDFQASTAHLPLPEAFFECIVTESL